MSNDVKIPIDVRRKNKMNYIGMDIHKQFTFAVVKDEQGNEIARDKFENSQERFSNFLSNFPSNEAKIVIESTCVWEYIYEILEAMNYDVKLANPIKTKAIAYAHQHSQICLEQILLQRVTFLQKK
jgi:transposase